MAKTIGSFDLASLKYLRDDVTQYFWFEPDSSSAWGSGAHVTLYPESQFTDSTSPNYMKGQNIIMNTDGFSIRNGALPMMVLDNDSLDFNAVDTTLGTYTTMATFGLTGATIGRTSGAHIQISSSGLDVNTNSSTNIASFGTSGARIGKNTTAHSIIDADGQRFYASNGTTQLANIGYGKGKNESGSTSTDKYPYFSFGLRDSESESNRGNYSFAEGYRIKSIGFASHAEGNQTTASGNVSHAEGSTSTASGNVSHAEGSGTTASGLASHAQNYGTIAQRWAQTAIGKWNEPDTSGQDEESLGDYALIIGNGTAHNARSNAFTVDWDGNVEAASALFANGAEFSKRASNHIVIGGYHVCWGRETISHTGSGYKETQVTLPYTYTSAPYCFASYGNRPTGGAARTAYATQSNLAGNKIYVGSYATGSVDAYVNWMTIGV